MKVVFISGLAYLHNTHIIQRERKHQSNIIAHSHNIKHHKVSTHGATSQSLFMEIMLAPGLSPWLISCTCASPEPTRRCSASLIGYDGSQIRLGPGAMMSRQCTSTSHQNISSLSKYIRHPYAYVRKTDNPYCNNS